MTKKEKQIFWDYDMNSIDLTDERIKVWFLSRKLNFGDFSGITKKDLRKYLSKFDISSTMKKLLKNYLNAKN